MPKRLPTFKEIYKGIRKPVPPPERVERDKREELDRKGARKEIDEHKGRRPPSED